MAEKPASRDLRRPVIASSAAVVTCFVVATAFAEYRTRLGGHPAVELASAMSPRLELLADAATRLQNLADSARWQEQPCTDGDCGSTRALSTTSRDVGEALSSYTSSLQSPVAWADRLALLATQSAVESELHKLSLRAGSSAVAIRRVLAESIAQEQRGVLQAIGTEVRSAAAEAQRVAGSRRRRMFLVIILDSVSVVMAVILTRLALRAAVARQTLNQRRSDELESFAGRVAHDILTPIASAEMAAALAIRHGGGREVAALERITRSLRRTRVIADGLLEFARAGARPRPGATASVREAVAETIADVSAEARAVGVEIVAAQIVAAEVACSRGALASILGNLLTNSIRYMGERTVREVYIRAEAVNRSVHFEVEDTGPGLPSARGKDLFEPFVRGDNASGTGVGLGLATVKRLVEAHGGVIRAATGEQGGCLIAFDLPEAVRLHSPAPRTAFETHANASGSS